MDIVYSTRNYKAAARNPTYSVDARAEWCGQRIGDIDVRHALVIRQAVHCHAILRDPGLVPLFDIVKKGQVCFRVFITDLLESLDCWAEPLQWPLRQEN